MEKQRPGRLPGVLIVLIGVLVLVMVVYTHHERTGENLSRVSAAREPSPAVAEAEARAQRAREAKQEADGAKQEAEGERQVKAEEAAVAKEAKTMEASEGKKAGTQNAARPSAASKASNPNGAPQSGQHPSAEVQQPSDAAQSAPPARTAPAPGMIPSARVAQAPPISQSEGVRAIQHFASEVARAPNGVWRTHITHCGRVVNSNTSLHGRLGGIACFVEYFPPGAQCWSTVEALGRPGHVYVIVLGRDGCALTRHEERPHIEEGGAMFSLQPGSIKLDTPYEVHRSENESDALPTTKSATGE